MTVHRRLEPGKYRLDAEAYACLGDAGLFGDAGTELIGGEVIVMSPEWRPHMRIKDELAYRLRRALEKNGSSLFVGTGGSIALGQNDMPRADIIVTGDIDGEHAVPVASIALLVEVASTPLGFDIGEKSALYAGAGVPEYWVVDVNGRLIHQLWQPVGRDFQQRRESGFGTPLQSATMSTLTVETETL